MVVFTHPQDNGIIKGVLSSVFSGKRLRQAMKAKLFQD